MTQVLIAIDQVFNTFTYIKGDGFGFADETLSARAWRLREQSPYPYRIINGLFFWQENHCKEAYESEVNNKHLPKEYGVIEHGI
jgi:hypothetical protein